ncbi:hypothetical protein [Rubrivirga sp.]|uniref:hypothetical protein n=1 Tax=Rubrivirga sp. TaxID=1885344 RepID=UPI003B51CF48
MRSLVAAVAAALVLSACQDPAGVGLGLIDEEQLDPNVRTVLLTDVAPTADTTVAIGIASDRDPALIQSRVLVGRVQDPVFGDARSVAYVDFVRLAELPDDAEAADVTAAWLVLERSYTYGDTTTTLPLELRPVQGSWTANTGYPADTLFATGDLLATTDVAPADTSARFDLPASWVAANAATLLSDTFGDDFEGFGIDVPAGFTPSPGAVVGFDTFASTGSGLRVVVAGDTVAYALSEVFSSIAVTPAPGTTPNVLPARVGSESVVRFNADFGTVGPAALARARLSLPLDLSLTREGSFVRPVPSRSFLVGVRTVDGEERRFPLSDNVVFDGGELTVFDTGRLTAEVQQVLLDPGSAFERYELVPLRGAASLDILPILLSGAPDDRAPRFTLTVVGASG